MRDRHAAGAISSHGVMSRGQLFHHSLDALDAVSTINKMKRFVGHLMTVDLMLDATTPLSFSRQWSTRANRSARRTSIRAFPSIDPVTTYEKE